MRKIFDQSDISKFGCQMKAYDPLISKLSLDLKSIKNFSSYSGFKNWNFGFFQNFRRKNDFTRDTGMPPS